MWNGRNSPGDGAGMRGMLSLVPALAFYGLSSATPPGGGDSRGPAVSPSMVANIPPPKSLPPHPPPPWENSPAPCQDRVRVSMPSLNWDELGRRVSTSGCPGHAGRSPWGQHGGVWESPQQGRGQRGHHCRVQGWCSWRRDHSARRQTRARFVPVRSNHRETPKQFIIINFRQAARGDTRGRRWGQCWAPRGTRGMRQTSPSQGTEGHPAVPPPVPLAALRPVPRCPRRAHQSLRVPREGGPEPRPHEGPRARWPHPGVSRSPVPCPPRSSRCRGRPGAQLRLLHKAQLAAGREA